MNSNIGHGFFEAISQLFTTGPHSGRPGGGVPHPDSTLSEIEQAFNTALQQLNSKIEQLRLQQTHPENGAEFSPALAVRAREERMQQAHLRIRGDVLAMHAKLASGIDAPALDALGRFLQECVDKVVEGKGSEEVLSCCRSSILRRFHREAGSVAWQELEGRLAVSDVTWPETTQRDPIESDTAFEQRRQLKYRETVSTFVAYELERSAQLIYGIERAWQADYPEPASPLWRELVLEGVATGLRAGIFRHYCDLLLKHREMIQQRATELVGQELENLRAALAEKSLTSLEDAHRVAASSSRVLSEVIPEIAWQTIRSAEPPL